jgi:cell division protease FtsH
MIETSYQRTLGILRENKDKLTLLADKLLEKEVIFRDDLELIFGKSKFEEELKEEKKISKKKSSQKKKKIEEEVSVNEDITEKSEMEDKTKDTFEEKS